MRQPARVSTRGNAGGTPPFMPEGGGKREPAVSRGQQIAQGAALAFNQLRSNPDRSLAKQFQSQNEQATQKQAKNRTVEWLRGQGRADLADAVEAGTISGRDAFGVMSQRPEQPTPNTDMAKLNADLRAGLITPQQYEMAQAQMGRGDPSAAEEKLALLQEINNPRTGQPFTRQEAIEVNQLYDVSRDPVTREVQIINRANGQIIGGGQSRQQGGQETEPQQQAQGGQQGQHPGGAITYGAGDASDAFGAEGLLKSGINAAGDFVGLGTAFPDVQTTTSDFATLREQLLSDIAAAYPRQPPSWLMQEIRQLTPSAGSGQGAEAAQSKLGSLDRYFDNEMRLAQRQLQNAQTPQQRSETEAKIAQLEAARARVGSALSSFNGGGNRGRTSSGIEWEIVE